MTEGGPIVFRAMADPGINAVYILSRQNFLNTAPERRPTAPTIVTVNGRREGAEIWKRDNAFRNDELIKREKSVRAHKLTETVRFIVHILNPDQADGLTIKSKSCF
jgi:hypothetical protein